MISQITSRLTVVASATRSIACAFLVTMLGVFLSPAAIASEAPKAQDAHAPAKVEAEHGAKAEGAAAHKEDGHGKGEHKAGLTPDAPKLFWGFFNSSMVATWLVAGLIIWGAQSAMRHRKLVPDGSQNFWEFMVEGLHGFLSGILGRTLASQTFWFFATVFIFILANNWFGLLPGVGTIGWGHGSVIDGVHYPRIHDHVTAPILRGGNADLNMTSAMALTFFLWWIVWAVNANSHGRGPIAGVIGVFKHLFAPKGDSAGVMKAIMVVIFAAVGVLELISIMFRPVSLSFRLFGNVFAGETTLEAMQQVLPALGWLLPVPFYFLELLVGIIQALVFMLLTAVFTLLICEHHEEEHHEEGGDKKAHH